MRYTTMTSSATCARSLPVRAIDAAIAAADKTTATIEKARHYFEPDTDAGHVDALMDVVVPWIRERFA